MSKTYLVRLPLALFLTPDQLARRGRLTMGFDLMNILAPERMVELLGEILKNAGWEENDGKWLKDSPCGGFWTIDPAAHTVGIDVTRLLEQEIAVRSYGEAPPTEAAATAAARLTIETHLQGLEEAEKELIVREAVRARQALAEVLKDVYRQALQEKAQSLGNVVSVTETSQDGTMRIRIEIT